MPQGSQSWYCVFTPKFLYCVSTPCFCNNIVIKFIFSPLTGVDRDTGRPWRPGALGCMQYLLHTGKWQLGLTDGDWMVSNPHFYHVFFDLYLLGKCNRTWIRNTLRCSVTNMVLKFEENIGIISKNHNSQMYPLLLTLRFWVVFPLG